MITIIRNCSVMSYQCNTEDDFGCIENSVKRLGLGTGNGDRDRGLGLGTGIGDWNWGMGLGTGIEDLNWRVGLGTRIGDGDGDGKRE